MSVLACEPTVATEHFRPAARAPRCDAVAPRSDAVAPEFLARILAPYEPTGTDYLKAASVEPGDLDVDSRGKPLATARGRYRIESSCYIQSTGHFNAVEFLICYNQLAYATFGRLVADRVLATLPEGRVSAACQLQLQRVSIDTFFAKQLSSMFILRAGTRFKRVIDTDDFHCELSVDSIMYRHGTFFIETTCRFFDERGGEADGNVLLAYPVLQS